MRKKAPGKFFIKAFSSARFAARNYLAAHVRVPLENFRIIIIFLFFYFILLPLKFHILTSRRIPERR